MMSAIESLRSKPASRRPPLDRVIRAEFEEMPGLTLTLLQASRLWGAPPRELEPVLQSLVREGFLVRGPRNTYRRFPCPRCA